MKRSVGLNKRRAISRLAPVILLLITAVVGAVWFSSGPRYQGKSAGYWATQLVRNEPAARGALLELGPAAVPALTDAIRVRQSWLANKLEWLRPRLPKWIGRRLLSPAEAHVRQQRALTVLCELGPSAAPAMPALLALDCRVSDEFYFYPSSPQRVIFSIGEAGVPHLARVLERGNVPATRVAAAMYLGLIGAKAAPASHALAKALRDSSPGVRHEAVRALDQIGPPAADALPALRAALQLDNDDFRLQVAQTLWDIGQDAALTVPVLVKVLGDPHHPNRARAATILARMGPAAKAAAPALTAVTEEPFSYTRVKAEEALKLIAGPEGTQATDKLK